MLRCEKKISVWWGEKMRFTNHGPIKEYCEENTCSNHHGTDEAIVAAAQANKEAKGQVVA